jgi:protein-arginine kinase activator protein McsA
MDKYCQCCGEVKIISSFSKVKNSEKRKNYCRECYKKYNSNERYNIVFKKVFEILTTDVQTSELLNNNLL